MNKQITLLLFLTLFLSSCSLPNSHKESLINQLEHEDERHHPETELSMEEELIDYNYLPFLEMETETTPFHVLTRQEEIVKYPCSSCHTSNNETTPSTVPAHPTIKLEHAASSTMNCTSCHTTETTANPDSLHSLTEEPISFDQSYLLCAQCHNSEFDDWQGGAHGKSLGGWAPPRVIQNCTGCHNPHNPTIQPRWPAIINGGN